MTILKFPSFHETQERIVYFQETRDCYRFAHLIFSRVTFVDNKHREGQELASVQTTVGHEASEATPDPLQKLGLSSKGFDSLTPGWPVSSFRNNQTDE